MKLKEVLWMVFFMTLLGIGLGVVEFLIKCLLGAQAHITAHILSLAIFIYFGLLVLLYKTIYLGYYITRLLDCCDNANTTTSTYVPPINMYIPPPQAGRVHLGCTLLWDRDIHINTSSSYPHCVLFGIPNNYLRPWKPQGGIKGGQTSNKILILLFFNIIISIGNRGRVTYVSSNLFKEVLPSNLIEQENLREEQLDS